ncbi:MFS transporter [Streptacidiphilus sp. P02-A3a]|uniref:MFS transporter n=1 Tax=Streptacidiphilus sp. P02-A3a TaxID=2704468 RepID=UPI0015FA2EA0|nr:MFS transporter [Streptacidiphilus sp. P02-A3a]QMU67097.1 MFS transporter [Streptacidiphilus sp. P02-A3a]
MTTLHTSTAGREALPARPRAALPALCATQITGYGVLYYAFPVLTGHITAQTGWPTGQVTAAFTAALLLSAAVGIPVGRILDQRGPHLLMTGGSILGTAALVIIATAPDLPVFAAGWLLAGTAMAATLYQPAFAALARWHDTDRVRALTTLTLAAGLASTVFAPLTAILAAHLTWRDTYLTLAAVLGAITIPAHALALRGPWTRDETGPLPGIPRQRPQARITTSRPFLLLAVAMTVSGFALYGVIFGLVPLLTHRGMSPTLAAWALGLGGLGQTLGRTAYAAFTRRTSVRARTVALIAAGGATTLLLALVPGPTPLLIALVILAGGVRGNFTLLQATAVIDRWGTTAYGHLSGILAAPIAIAEALTPFAAATLVHPLGGYPQLFAALAATSAVAALLASGTSIGGGVSGSTD